MQTFSDKKCDKKTVSFLNFFPVYTLKLILLNWYVFFPVLFVIGVVGGCASWAYVNFLVQHTSVAKVRYGAFTRYEDLASAGEFFCSSDLARVVAVELERENVKWTNGNEISPTEIKSGMSFECSIDSSLISVRFTSKDSDVCNSILNCIVETGTPLLVNIVDNYSVDQCYIYEFAVLQPISQAIPAAIFFGGCIIGAATGAFLTIKCQELKEEKNEA